MCFHLFYQLPYSLRPKSWPVQKTRASCVVIPLFIQGKPAGDQHRRIRIFIPFAPSWKVRPTLPEKNQTTRYHFPVFCLPYCNLPVQAKTVPTLHHCDVRRKTQERWFFPGTAPAPGPCGHFSRGRRATSIILSSPHLSIRRFLFWNSRVTCYVHSLEKCTHI